MSYTEATTKIIIAMIENNKLATKEDIVSAYETIYQKISQLKNGNNSKKLEDYNEKVFV